jgi:hypothetical protein
MALEAWKCASLAIDRVQPGLFRYRFRFSRAIGTIVIIVIVGEGWVGKGVRAGAEFGVWRWGFGRCGGSGGLGIVVRENGSV